MPPFPVDSAPGQTASAGSTDATAFSHALDSNQSQNKGNPLTRTAKSIVNALGSALGGIWKAIPGGNGNQAIREHAKAQIAAREAQENQRGQAAINAYPGVSAAGEVLLHAAANDKVSVIQEFIQNNPGILLETVSEDRTIQNPEGSISGSNRLQLGEALLIEAAKAGNTQTAITLLEAKTPGNTGSDNDQPGQFLVQGKALEHLALRSALTAGHTETAHAILHYLGSPLSNLDSFDQNAQGIVNLIAGNQAPEAAAQLKNAREILDDLKTKVTAHHSVQGSFENWILQSGSESAKNANAGQDFSDALFTWLPPQQREEAIVNYIIELTGSQAQVDQNELNPGEQEVDLEFDASPQPAEQQGTRQANPPVSVDDLTEIRDNRGIPIAHLNPMDFARQTQKPTDNQTN